MFVISEHYFSYIQDQNNKSICKQKGFHFDGYTTSSATGIESRPPVTLELIYDQQCHLDWCMSSSATRIDEWSAVPLGWMHEHPTILKSVNLTRKFSCLQG